jgi:hypothetical protein
MPEDTMVPAADFTEFSVTVHLLVYQLFQPIGGVAANPLSRAGATTSVRAAAGAAPGTAAIAGAATNATTAAATRLALWFIHPRR